VPTISNATLTVDAVVGHAGQRCVRVAYDIVCDPNDPVVGSTMVERVVIHAVDEHDATAPPRRRPILRCEEALVATAGTDRRTLERIVNRFNLDVQEDWWSTNHGGEPVPIAEWLDHIAADIRLDVGGELAAETTTPTVTGSWGALGQD